MKRYIVLILLLFTKYSCIAQMQPLNYNLGFEHWDTASLQNDSIAFTWPVGVHQIANPYKGNLAYGWTTNFHGTHRTTDAFSGQYALVIHQWYTHAHSWARLGNCPPAAIPNANDSCLLAVPQKVYGLSGYYKFYEADSGRAKLTITTYKKNAATQALTILTKDSLLFAPAAAYTYFNLYIQAPGTAIQPDSIALRFDVGGPFCNSINPGNCYFLYLDDLELHYSPYTALGIQSTPGSNISWKAYPNPADRIVKLEYPGLESGKICLYNTEGKILTEANWPQTKQLDVSQLPAGVYYLRASGNSQQVQPVKKIIVVH